MSTAPAPASPADADRALRALGIVRLPIPVPFAEAGGVVNLYLLDNPDGSLTMFDTGIGTAAGVEQLHAGFAAAGRRLEDVRRILISHGHLDHYGGARLVQARAGAPVLVHPRDLPKIVRSTYEHHRGADYDAYLPRLGVPAEAVRGMNEIYRRQRTLVERLDAATPLAAGARVELRAFTAEVLDTPGHTPGHVCLHAPAARVLFTGDHLLARISPNPLLELGPRGEEDKFRALSAYLTSLDRVAALDVDWILPGHGAPFTGHRAVIARLLRFHEQRQAKISAALAAAARTPYELVHDVFGRAGVPELFLMLSEIVGNLEVLEERGVVERLPDTLPYRYRPRA